MTQLKLLFLIFTFLFSIQIVSQDNKNYAQGSKKSEIVSYQKKEANKTSPEDSAKINSFEKKPSRHRFIFIPLTFSGSVFKNAEEQENAVNSYYSTVQSSMANSNYKSLSESRHGSRSIDFNLLEYRFRDRLRLFYINRSAKSRFEPPSSFTVFNYKNTLIGQNKNYLGSEAQERFGLAYFHPITSTFHLGAMISNYWIQQRYGAESITIIANNSQGFGYESSKNQMRGIVPGIGFEWSPILFLENLFHCKLDEDLSIFRYLQIIYTNEFLKTNSSQSSFEYTGVTNFNSNIPSPTTPINVSPIYTLRNFQYTGTIHNYAFIIPIVNWFGIRAGFVDEAYQRNYNYYSFIFIAMPM